MKLTHKEAHTSGWLPQITEDYLLRKPDLNHFFDFEVSTQGFAQAIESRRKKIVNRDALVEAFTTQYKSYNLWDEARKSQIERLQQEDVFTVTTGHQCCFFGGPLYFVYKIAGAIKLANDLKNQFPENQFVPVFWMATEDHDSAEIESFSLFGKKITWNHAQSGAVGRFHMKDAILLLDELKSLFGTMPEAENLLNFFEIEYCSAQNLAEATAKLVHFLFPQTHLLVLDADNAVLKKQFSETIKKEILENFAFEKVKTSLEKLSKYNLPVNPREINFFYLDGTVRERIVEENGQFKILNSDLSFTQTEMQDLIEKSPEKFSPNVVFRPLYQESILPNLAYIGGGSELAYWLELKSTFEAVDTFFPVLMLRNSALWLNKGICSKMAKNNLGIEHLFENADTVVKNILKEEATYEIDLAKQYEQATALFEPLLKLASLIDASLTAPVAAEEQKLKNALHNLEQKFIRAEKKNKEVMVNQIYSVYEKLFPNGGLQERSENFSSIFLIQGRVFIETLLKEFTPLNQDILIVQEAEQ